MTGNQKFLLGLGLLVMAMAGGYWFGLSEPALPQKTTPAKASLPTVSRLLVKELSGEVNKRTKAGQTLRLVPGDALVENDEIRTEREAHAVLDTEDGKARVTVGPESHVGIVDLTHEIRRFFLNGGSIEAKSDGAPLEFSAVGTSGRVLVTRGVSHLLSDGAIGLSVGTESGSAEVNNHGKTVTVAAGEATRVVGEKDPGPIWKIPPSLLLKVEWPSEDELAQKHLAVKGQSSPGALVQLRSVKTLADEYGRFSLDVPLDEGMNDLMVAVEDPSGKKKSSRKKVRVDTTPANVGVETSPDMWKTRAGEKE